MRGRAWLYLCGGKVKRERNVNTFKELENMEGDPKWMDIIQRDLHRQFPFHEMFLSREGHGQQDLLQVLKAYTLYRPEEGYCQAQAPIAAVLLMHMPAEDAFWGLVQICEKYLPGYYSPGLESVQLDGEILHALLKRVSPVAYRHLDKHKIEPVLYMMEWFMCVFSRTLPWASVLRVWDMFLCDGVKIIFRVGLVFLRCMLGSKEKLKACPGQYETMELLRAIEPRYMQEAFLVQQVLELPVSARDVEREHRSQLKRWKKKRGEPSRKPAPRMHGAYAIMSSEPHSRQDLCQNPTIIVQYPPATGGKSEFGRGKKRGSLKKNSTPFPDIPNPYALPDDFKSNQIRQAQPLNQEDKVPAPQEAPIQASLDPTKQEEVKTSTERLVRSTPSPSISQKSHQPESLPAEHQPVPAALEWCPHLQVAPPEQFSDPPPVLLPAPLPYSEDFPADHPADHENHTALDPPTDSSPLLTHNAPSANQESTPAPENKVDLRISTESVNSSEDTYL
ncbi:TBC1 domain family member 10A isoform X2 [Trichomycterus rosablanca]